MHDHQNKDYLFFRILSPCVVVASIQGIDTFYAWKQDKRRIKLLTLVVSYVRNRSSSPICQDKQLWPHFDCRLYAHIVICLCTLPLLKFVAGTIEASLIWWIVSLQIMGTGVLGCQKLNSNQLPSQHCSKERINDSFARGFSCVHNLRPQASLFFFREWKEKKKGLMLKFELQIC